MRRRTTLQSSVVLSNGQAYQSGSYTAYIAAFNTGGLVYGTDYTEQITLNPTQFPNALSASWNFPTTNVASIKSFIAIDYGNYYNTTPQIAIIPTTLNNITTLSQSANFTLSGNLQGFDVITDAFLTTLPNDNSTNAAEVEVFLHTPTYASSWVSSLTQLGSVTVSGIQWTVAEGTSNGLPDIIFMPTSQQDVSSNTIDLASIFHYIVAQGVVSGSLYFNGSAFGVETDSGSGSLNLSNLSLTFSGNSSGTQLSVSLSNQTGVTSNSLAYTTNASLSGHSASNTNLSIYDESGFMAVVNSDASGRWSYDPTKSLSSGYHDFSVTEMKSDGTTSSASIDVMFSNALETMSESIVGGSGKLVNGLFVTGPTVSGMTSPNTEVMLYDNNNYFGEVLSDSAGSWSYHVSNPASGTNTIVASATNMYGSAAESSTTFGFK